MLMRPEYRGQIAEAYKRKIEAVVRKKRPGATGTVESGGTNEGEDGEGGEGDAAARRGSYIYM